MIQLLLALLLCQQPPQQPAPASGGWYEVDGMFMIINEDTVTMRQFSNRLKERLDEHRGEDRQAAAAALMRDIKIATVSTQAGETMGIDPALIARSVHDWERRMIDSKGGMDDYAKFLTEKGLTAEDMREQTRRTVLRQVWEESRTGKGPNQEQHVIADRYVRPGFLRLTYTRIAREPRAVGLIGGTPSKVVLQILEVDPAKVGGTAQAESAATKMRARIATGASDFEAESGFIMPGTQYGPRDPVDESALPSADPLLAKFVATAKEGELLPLIAPEEKIPQWRIVRLVKRIPAVVPEFKSPGLQQSLRTLVEDNLDEMRLGEARTQQFEGSYIWLAPPSGH